jgi:toxin-antitoxin system, antitoxin component, hicB family
MDRVLYPCKIRKEDGVYYVEFVDFPECFTDGESPEEVLTNARDVLEGIIFSYIKNGKPLPSPSFFEKGFADVTYIDAWVGMVRDRVNNQAVRKTLTIPKWLNDIAEKNAVNFSAVLQTGLKEYLNIS